MSARVTGLVGSAAIGAGAAGIGYLNRDAVRVVVEGDATVIRQAYTVIACQLGVGIALLSAGVVVFITSASGAKVRRLAIFLSVVGTLVTAGVASTAPFESVQVSPDRLIIQGGVLGVGIQREINLSNATALNVYEAWRRRRKPGKRRARYQATFIQIVTSADEPTTLEMSSSVRKRALDALIEQQRVRGVPVNDDR